MNMKSYKVVMIVNSPLLPHDRSEYEKIGADFVKIPCETEEEIIDATRDADFVITMMKPLTRKVIEKMNQCRMIYNIGTGYEAIDLKAATEKGICVSFPGGYCSLEVAEHAMGLILDCARKISRLDRAVRAGQWDSFEKKEIRKIFPPMFQLKGQTVGIIGFGRIGQNLVPMAKGFGMKVVVYDPYVPSHVFEKLGVEQVTFDYLIENSDFITIHALFTPSSRHMFNIETFKKMKSTAYLINCARGGFVDEQALYTAIEKGEIAGAGLDIVENEFLNLDDPLLKLENITFTPHSAYYSEESKRKITVRPYEDISLVIKGAWPKCLVNSEVREAYEKRWGVMKEE